jgi:hypothetical protein
LVHLPLNGGTYGSRIERPNLSLPVLYSQISHSWNPPDDYTLNWKLPFFELYRPNWANRSAVKICIPLNFSINSLRKGPNPPY